MIWTLRLVRICRGGCARQSSSSSIHLLLSWWLKSREQLCFCHNRVVAKSFETWAWLLFLSILSTVNDAMVTNYFTPATPNNCPRTDSLHSVPPSLSAYETIWSIIIIIAINVLCAEGWWLSSAVVDGASGWGYCRVGFWAFVASGASGGAWACWGGLQRSAIGVMNAVKGCSSAVADVGKTSLSIHYAYASPQASY